MAKVDCSILIIMLFAQLRSTLVIPCRVTMEASVRKIELGTDVFVDKEQQESNVGKVGHHDVSL